VGTITTPSPQISEQLLAVVKLPRVQLHRDSTAQDELQPSPLIVFPSSQYPAVGFITLPSPQVSDQELAVVLLPDVQVYPVSTEQLESHPSPEAVFPSSQYPEDVSITFPSPQI